jgi:hypothetical protein
MSSEGTKRCGKCGEVKEIGAFAKDRRIKSGRSARCQTCSNAYQGKWRGALPEKDKERGRLRRAALRGVRRPGQDGSPHYNRSRLTGASPRLQDTIWAAQAGQCAICKDPQEHKSAHLDHCHDSGVVRGFLCRGCNLGLGHFRDRPELLRGAAAYLGVHQSTDRETLECLNAS